MISPENIERRDFSDAIPDIAAKIVAIGSALLTYGESEWPDLESDQCKGFGLMLCEIEDDLLTIGKALYDDGMPIFPKRKVP